MTSGDHDPFQEPLSTYLWVVGLALLGGLVKYLNHVERFRWLILVRDLVTAGFCGLLTFWMCQWLNVSGPLSAVLIATSGLMGTRLLKELETFYKIRMGMLANPVPEGPSVQPPHSLASAPTEGDPK